MAPKPILVSRENTYPIAAAALWELVGNTEHVNRLIGLPKVHFGPVEDTAEGMFRPATARMLGMKLEWREYAFDWVRNRSHAVLRVYKSGPLRRARLGLELTPEGEGCRMRQFAELWPRPRFPLARLMAPRIARKSMDALHRHCEELARRAAAAGPAPVALPAPAVKGLQRATLERLLARLRSECTAEGAAITRLARLLAEGSDEEVLHMQPYALARRWSLPRLDVLRTFLFATTVGLLEMDWELMCPNCRVPKARFRNFGTVSDEFHCDLCGTLFAADLDRTTELRFSVHPTVREAEDAIYCIGGPHNGRHILVQQGLRPGETDVVHAMLPDEPLRARILRLNRTVALEPSPDGATDVALAFKGDDWNLETLAFRPGEAALRLSDEGKAAQVAVIERVEWDPDAATAARVMALPEFRAMFSAEVLQPGRQLGIRNLCVLFTDLKGSTALYEKVGDAPAYGQVHRHFDFLVECCQHHEGGIVKTIGDAVMASFPSPLHALRAALDMQTRVAAFNAKLGAPEPIVIKIGLHHGPAIAVNANGQVDYFGRTVNIAARIQGLSDGGDIVLTDALWNDAAIQAELDAAARNGTVFDAAHFRATLKGIGGEAELCRLTPREAPAQAEAPREARAQTARPRLFYA